MAELEAEIFSMGKWESFEHLENSISLNELDLLIKQKRDEDKQWRYFHAAIQGIDLQKNEKDATEKRLQEVRERAAARLAGGEGKLEAEKLTGLGFRVKTV